MTQGSTRSLARVAVERGIVPQIAHSTVSRILRAADLQPHRARYWKTPTLDATFRARTAPILWCDERAAVLAARGELVICLDAMPNLQVLERRCPTRTARTGQIERREFESIRHGTVTFLAALVVHSGRMRGGCLDANDSDHLRPALGELFRAHRGARRIHVIWDGGSSHTAAATTAFLHDHHPRVRTLVTPPHASWLDQAELLLRAFRARYLTRGDWPHREAFVAHLDASWREYNRLFAHPFEWSWTRPKRDRWLAHHER